MDIQKEIDNATDKERDSLFNNLQYLGIDFFSYQGKVYYLIDLMQDRSRFLDLPSVILSDGTIFLNGGIVKEIDDFIF